MTDKPNPEMRRIVEIADPIAHQIAADYKAGADPMKVWSEHVGALALLLATLLEQLNQENETAARNSFTEAVDNFLKTLRSTNRPRKP